MNPVTSIIDLIKYALKALTAFLELRRETYFLEASAKHLEYKESIRNEITFHLKVTFAGCEFYFSAFVF